MKPPLFQNLLLLIILGAISIFIAPLSSYAHPGRTDSSGCHTCRTNCPNWGLSYGEYHCHNAKALPQPKEPIRSHYGESGTGTTEPWPAYKNPTASPVKSVGATSNSTVSNTKTILLSTLSKGMSGLEVTRLQQLLAKDSSIYPDGLVTGYFGPSTENAVKRFQKKYGLDQVGYVGSKTRALLNSL